MRSRILLPAVCLVAATGVALAAGDLKSGPQVGDPVGAYNVTKITGPSDGVQIGAQLCYR